MDPSSPNPTMPPVPASKYTKAARWMRVLVICFGITGALASFFVLLSGLWPLTLYVGLPLSVLASLILPVGLVWRATQSLKQKGAGPLTCRVLELSLLTLLHMALIFAVMDWANRTAQDVAATAHRMSHQAFGNIPLLSQALQNLAEGSAQPLYADGLAPNTKAPTWGNTTDHPLDGGPQIEPSSATAAAGGTGVNSQEASSTGTKSPSGLDREPDDKTKPPEDHKPHHGVYIQLSNGDRGIWKLSVDEKGTHEGLWLPETTLMPNRKPSALSFAQNGLGVVVIDRKQTFRVTKDGQFAPIEALTRGFKIQGGLEVRNIHDVMMGRAGFVLAVIDTYWEAKSSPYRTGPTLVGWSPEQANHLEIYRRIGDSVPHAVNHFVTDLELGIPDQDEGFTLLESYKPAPLLSPLGEPTAAYVDASQRILQGHLDAPKASQEVARTGQPAGLRDHLRLKHFGHVTSLSDGRVVFSSTFFEHPGKSLFFSGDSRGTIATITPRLGGQNEFLEATHLSGFAVAGDGHLAFSHPTLGLMKGHIDRAELSVMLPAKAMAEGQGSQQTHSSRRGTLFLSPSGSWLLIQTDHNNPWSDVHNTSTRQLLLIHMTQKPPLVETLLTENQPLPNGPKGAAHSAIDVLELN